MQETKYRIEKKSPVLYESQYTRDNDVRKATYHLNDKGLLSFIRGIIITEKHCLVRIHLLALVYKW